MTDWPTEKDRIAARMEACKTVQQLRAVWVAEQSAIQSVRAGELALGIQIVNLKDYLKPGLLDDPAMQHPPIDEVPA